MNLKSNTKIKTIVILGNTGTPKLLGSDISAKQVLEAMASDTDILFYAGSMAMYRSVKNKPNLEAIDALEKAFVAAPSKVYCMKSSEVML